MWRDSGFFRNRKDAFSGHLSFFPTKDSRFVDAKRQTKLLKGQRIRDAVGAKRVCRHIHDHRVAYNATHVKTLDAFGANDGPRLTSIALRMGRPPKTTHFHYIAERIVRKKLSQADIARALDVDKSTVSRWCSGGLPSDMWLIALAKLLTEDGEPASLFRHPDEDRSIRLTRGRSADEISRIEKMVEIAFPKADCEVQ